MIKVSVIIPVYNAEKYLEKCIDSVINQTLREIEIICIDDFSTDKSLDILNAYALKDRRIKVLKNGKNLGPSITRNKGIEIATGEFMQFVDSDDYIELNGLEELYRIASKNKLDVLLPSVKYSGDMSGNKVVYSEKVINKIFDGKELFVRLMQNKQVHFATWCVFINMKLLKSNKILFIDDIYHEDVIFIYDILLKAKYAMCVNKSIYVYFVHRNSITTMEVNEKHLIGLLTVIKQVFYSVVKDEFTSDFKLAALSFLIIRCRYYFERNIKRNSNVTISNWNEDFQQLYNILNISVNMNLLNSQVQKIKAAKNIYIYGAGVVAKQLLGILDDKNIDVNGIIVTNKEKNKKKLFGYNITSIYEYDKFTEEDLVIVATTKKFHKEIQNVLVERSLSNIIYVTDK